MILIYRRWWLQVEKCPTVCKTPLDAGELIFTFDAFPQNQGRANIALP